MLMKFLGAFECGDRKPRKSNFDIKIAEVEVLSLTYFSIDIQLRKGQVRFRLQDLSLYRELYQTVGTQQRKSAFRMPRSWIYYLLRINTKWSIR